jgi:hypothetical protein
LRRPRRAFRLLLVARRGVCSALPSGDSRTGVQLKVTCLVAGVGGRGLSLSDWTSWNHDEAMPKERSFMLPSKNLDVLAARLVLVESLGDPSSSLSSRISPASPSPASSLSSFSMSSPLGPREVFGRSSGSAKVFEGSKIRSGTCPCDCFRGCGIGRVLLRGGDSTGSSFGRVLEVASASAKGMHGCGDCGHCGDL